MSEPDMQAFPHWPPEARRAEKPLRRNKIAMKLLPLLIEVCKSDDRYGRSYAAHCACRAFEMADAMIAESERERV